jgi:hypothetical protein
MVGSISGGLVQFFDFISQDKVRLDSLPERSQVIDLVPTSCLICLPVIQAQVMASMPPGNINSLLEQSRCDSRLPVFLTDDISTSSLPFGSRRFHTRCCSDSLSPGRVEAPFSLRRVVHYFGTVRLSDSSKQTGCATHTGVVTPAAETLLMVDDPGSCAGNT